MVLAYWLDKVRGDWQTLATLATVCMSVPKSSNTDAHFPIRAEELFFLLDSCPVFIFWHAHFQWYSQLDQFFPPADNTSFVDNLPHTDSISLIHRHRTWFSAKIRQMLLLPSHFFLQQLYQASFYELVSSLFFRAAVSTYWQENTQQFSVPPHAPLTGKNDPCKLWLFSAPEINVDSRMKLMNVVLPCKSN